MEKNAYIGHILSFASIYIAPYFLLHLLPFGQCSLFLHLLPISVFLRCFHDTEQN